jgi:hypothetical protein
MNAQWRVWSEVRRPLVHGGVLAGNALSGPLAVLFLVRLIRLAVVRLDSSGEMASTCQAQQRAAAPERWLLRARAAPVTACIETVAPTPHYVKITVLYEPAGAEPLAYGVSFYTIWNG